MLLLIVIEIIQNINEKSNNMSLTQLYFDVADIWWFTGVGWDVSRQRG